MSRATLDKVTVPHIRDRKASRKDAERIVALTAYDHPTAKILDQAGVDIILVGDSVGNVVLGHRSTLPVTMDAMVHHTAAVTRARTRALVIADMPFLSYHDASHAVANAGRLVQEADAEGVKVEGGRARLSIVEAIVRSDIPVMGHIGLTPQALNHLGGYRVQGRDRAAVDALIADAVALEAAGVFCIVLEAMPAVVARAVTRAVSVPTIGIGAGIDCDGQILVIHDLVGLSAATPPRFVRRYADLAGAMRDAVTRFAADVRGGSFPSERESYGGPREIEEHLAENPGAEALEPRG